MRSAYYTYFIATLPALLFGSRPPYSFEGFISLSRRFIAEKDRAILNTIPLMERSFYEGPQETLRKWQDFETRLRNELAKVRSSKRHIDPLKYVRRYGHADTYLAHQVAHIQRNPSALDAQRLLDEERWRFLDELCLGHYFDLDALIVYCLKLLILERWDKIYSADKPAVLEEAIAKAGKGQ